MISKERRRWRRGATMVEAAIVLTVLFTLILGMLSAGLGVSYYQQVAALAREGARYASVHGASYAKDTGGSKATALSVYTSAILPVATGLDPKKITYSVTWDDAGQGPTYIFDATNNIYRVNFVTVTVSYSWLSLNFPGSPSTTRTLTSTSRLPVTY